MSIIGKPLPTPDQVRGRPFPGHTLRSFSRRLTLQQGGRLILGADLNRSELGWGRSALNVACGPENQDYHGAVEIFRPKTARRARSGSGPVLRRWRPDERAVSVLGRRGAASENPARHRRSPARGDAESAQGARGAGAAGDIRRRDNADEREWVRAVLPRRRRGDRQAREGHQPRPDELTIVKCCAAAFIAAAT